MGEVLREEQTARQKSADLTRAEQRLEQYAVEQGLERTHANAQAVADFIDASPVHGYWSREIIDAAIQNLGPKGTNVLTWMPRTAPAPPEEQPAEPTEILEPWQLPLDKAPTNKASAVQVKDWLARTREATGKYLRPRGSFSSKF